MNLPEVYGSTVIDVKGTKDVLAKVVSVSTVRVIFSSQMRITSPTLGTFVSIWRQTSPCSAPRPGSPSGTPRTTPGQEGATGS